MPKKRKPRPDVVLRNKSKKQREAIKNSWIDEKVREKRIEGIKKHTGFKKATYGHKGKKHTEEARRKIREARKKQVGVNHPHWQGDFPSYRAVHGWITQTLGKASEKFCELCGKKAHHWSNKDHKYRRNSNDFWALCGSCHKKYDFRCGFYKQKSHHPSEQTKRKISETLKRKGICPQLYK